MNPLFLIARALRSILARSPPRYRCAKRPRGHGRQPVWLPLGGKEPKPVPPSLSSPRFPQSIPSGNWVSNERTNDQWQGIENNVASSMDLPGIGSRRTAGIPPNLVFHRIGNKEAARLALARVKRVDELSPQPTMSSGEWAVAKVCEIFLADLHQSATLEWAKLVEKWLNDLCDYCGALKVEGGSEEASTDLDSAAQVVEPQHAAQRNCVCESSIQFLLQVRRSRIAWAEPNPVRSRSLSLGVFPWHFPQDLTSSGWICFSNSAMSFTLSSAALALPVVKTIAIVIAVAD